jgi:AcrR family transcriptional regulator
MSNSRGTHREALLQAATKLLHERGHAGITARDLVAASGTNLGSIGYHFGSKDALLNEAAGLALEEWVREIGRAIRLDEGVPPARRLAHSLAIVLDEFEEMRPYFLTFIETVARGARSPVIREQLTAHYRKQRARVAEMVTESFTGELNEAEAEHLASVLMGVSDGLMLQALVDPDSVPSSDELAVSCGKALAAALQQAKRAGVA